MGMIKTIQNRVEKINKVISSGVKKNDKIRPPKHLKNRSVTHLIHIGRLLYKNIKFGKE
jgi:hypothetical protein